MPTATESYLLERMHGRSHDDAVSFVAKSLRYELPGDAQNILDLEQRCLRALESPPPPRRKLTRRQTHGVVNAGAQWEVHEEPWWKDYEYPGLRPELIGE